MKIQKTGLKTIVIVIFFYFSFSLFNYLFVTEDAFIYFRFAENIVNGYGYVFNVVEKVGNVLHPGERVEGCSSVTWLFILTLFRSLEFNLLTTSKLLGILFGCISLFIIFQITKHFTVKMPWVILPSLLTSFTLPFIIWNQMGLETSLYTMVFLFLVLVCLNTAFLIYWPIIALLLILTRPEGVFLLLGLIPVLSLYKRNRVVLPVLLFLMLLMILSFIRFIYFHDFLPSPFYVKIIESKFLAGFQYIHQYFNEHYIYYFFLPLLFILPRKFNWQKKRIILLGFIVVYLAWIILGGAEPNRYYRHTVALIPLLYIYLITGIEQVISKNLPIKKVLISIYITTFCVLQLTTAPLALSMTSCCQKPIINPIAENLKYFISNPGGYLDFLLKRLQNPKEFNYVGADKSRRLLLGEFVRRNYPSGTTLLYDQMGRTPYQAGIGYYFTDTWGRTDIKIGRYYFNERTKASLVLQLFERITSNLIKRAFPQKEHINSRKEAVNYIFKHINPDVIMIVDPLRWKVECLPFWLINDNRFKKLYERKYLIEDTVVFEKRGLFANKQLNIPVGLSITYNKDIQKTLKNPDNKKLPESLKEQIDDAIYDNLSNNPILPKEEPQQVVILDNPV